MENKNNELYNLLGTYVTGTMMLNHISCVKLSMGASKRERHIANKMRAVEREVKSLIMPIELYLKAEGATDDVDSMIAKFHDLIDPIITPEEK